MPAISRDALQAAVLDAIAASGGIGLVAPQPKGNPLRFLVSSEGRRDSLWIYIWTLTPGGRPSLPNEYRIQLTSVTSPLTLNPQGATVLLGYEPNLQMFAGFDLSRHRTFTQGSPSIQIDIKALNSALQNGIDFEEKANNEIAIGIRPDHLVFYCNSSAEVHQFGMDSAALDILTRAVNLEEIAPDDMATLPQDRQRIIRETSQWARSASFRIQVLQAYGSRCAITRWQLRLVEAAHILPVASGSESIDNVRNGIALSPTYHRAFDRGLIYLDESFQMHINTRQAQDLAGAGLDSGLRGFQAPLGKIHLPPDRQQWPDPKFIRLANEYRDIH